MKLKIAQIIGLNTDQKAAQVSSSAREDPSMIGTGNTFLAVLELASDDAFTKGRQALSSLEDFYFEFEGSPADKLNAAFKEAESKLFQGVDFDLCLAVISGKVLYMTGKGNVEVFLKRGDKLSSLLSVGAPAQLVSGFLQDSDKLLFATTSLTSFLGDDLEKSLNLPTETFEEEVGGKIGAAHLENQGLAALVIEVIEQDEAIAPISSPGEYQESEPMQSEPAPKLKINFKGILKLGTSYFPKSGRGRLIIAVVLILVVVAGVGYKYKSSRDKETNTKFQNYMQEAKDNFEAAKGLANLNPVDAKGKLDLSLTKVNQAIALKPKDQSAVEFKKGIEQQTPSILQQSSVSDFPVFLDMDLVKKNFRAAQMSLSKGKVLLMDPGAKTLAVVDLAKKSNQILAGSEKLGEASFASLNGESAFVYSKDKGVLKIDTTNSKITTIAKTDSGWKDIKDIYGFAGNIYLLDSGQIWKYLPTSNGYSDKREYFTKTTQADLSSALRMQIESSVYVLKSGGEILRFTKGEKDNFSLSGLPSGVKDPKSIFISSDTDNLYVLDSGNSRLLILTKIGSYKGQITGNKFATATDLVVDEVGKKVYLLEGSKIFQADLK